MEPKGRDIMVTMSMSQPVLVCGPWMPMPPKKRKMDAAARRPVAVVQTPPLRSWAVPSCGRGRVRGLSSSLRLVYFHVMRSTPTSTPVTET